MWANGLENNAETLASEKGIVNRGLLQLLVN
jgi:hypothetical protein